MLDLLAAELPPVYGPRSEGWEAIVAGGTRSVAVELEHLRRDELPDAGSASVDVEGARRSARLGAGIDWFLFLYRAGHRAQWNAWFDAVEELELPPEQRRALLRHGSRFFFAYADRIGRLVADAYLAERDTIVGSREQRRMRAVTALLEEGEVLPEALDHPLEGRHLGVVATGPDARKELDRLAAGTGRRLLAVSRAEEEWWAWLSGPRELPVGEAALAERAAAGTTLGLGRDAEGVEGFRRSHEEARAAHHAAGDAGGLAFDAVALEALAAGDTAAAREFMAHELHGLEDASERSGRLRETLVAWFASGQNAAATAARLGVHEQTVASRLRAVEERTGRSPAGRRAELELALRLRRYLGS